MSNIQDEDFNSGWSPLAATMDQFAKADESKVLNDVAEHLGLHMDNPTIADIAAHVGYLEALAAERCGQKFLNLIGRSIGARSNLYAKAKEIFQTEGVEAWKGRSQQ